MEGHDVMARRLYKSKVFGEAATLVIARANRILVDYEEQGFDLTLRQLYYQFVAHDLFPDDRTWAWTGRKWIRDQAGTKNADPNYKWLGDIVNDARLAGKIDWDHITDRTRNLKSTSHWDTPTDLVDAAARQFRIDKWSDQPYRVEVWIEKDALVGVIGGICEELDVPYFSCRGYTSQSEMWSASQRLLAHIGQGQKVKLLHLGDHDPSGIDMTRDIYERLFKFIAIDHWREKMTGSTGSVGDSVAYIDGDDWFTVDRLALNMDQIEEYEPPPNPAKLSDSRAGKYVAEYGDESWELDALEPSVMADLIETSVLEIRDEDLWGSRVEEEDQHRADLAVAAERWSEVTTFLEDE